MLRPYAQVDVFGDGAATGNPLAVVLDGRGLDDKAMQDFAAWTNLSETTFLFPPTDPMADYAVRIFTAVGELPFAGHPTLGSAYAWLDNRGRPHRKGHLVQQCGVGNVHVRLVGDRPAFAAPQRRRTGPLDEAHLAIAEAALGTPRTHWVAHEWGDNGPPWMMIELPDAESVRRAWVDRTQLGIHDHLGLVGRFPGGEYAYEVRGIMAYAEDPVTGSLNASVAQWLRSRNAVPSVYVASQGSQVGHRGEVFVTDDGTDIWIGGRTRMVIKGKVDL